MKQAEQHIISKSHPFHSYADSKAVLSKNLFNAAMLYIKTEYESTGKYCNYFEVNNEFIHSNQQDYRTLAANVSQQVLMQVDRCWKSYFKALSSYKKDPSKFRAMPMPPKAKDKEWQRNMLTYTQRVISVKALRSGDLVLNSESTGLRTKLTNINQVQIVPMKDCMYKVILVYDREPEKRVESTVLAGCDIGVSNLVVVGFNDRSAIPFRIGGGPLKSINQYCNKRVGHLMSKLSNDRKSSKQIRKTAHKRNMKVNDYLHKMSRKVVTELKKRNTSKIVIGYNPEWKQRIKLGRVNNQNFVSIPFLKMINALAYKCELAGIESVVREESYTSKCSFLDREPIRKKTKYLGKRTRRGLYVASDGTRINADLNSAYNILTKEVPDAFADGIEGIVMCPATVTVTN